MAVPEALEMRTTSSPPFSEEEETLLAEEEVDESEEGQYISVVVVNRFRLTNIGYRNLEQWARAIHYVLIVTNY